MAGWMEALASGISATDGLLGTWAATMGNKRQLKRSYKLQRKQFDYESKENDKYTRALASDIDSLNVLSRRKAGLNPYAQETQGITPVSNSMPSAPQGFDVPFDSLAHMGSNAIRGYLEAAQAENIKEDTEGKKLDNKWKDPINEKSLANLDAAISLAQSQTKFNYANLENTEANTKDVVERLEMAKKAFPQTLKNLRLTNQELDAKIREIDNNIRIASEKLPLELQYLEASAYEAFLAGNLSKQNATYVFKSLSLLQEQIDVAMRDNVIGDAVLNYEIMGAGVEYDRKFKEVHGAELENKLKELAAGNQDWNEMNNTQRTQMVVNMAGTLVGIGSQLGVGYGAYQHGVTSKASRSANKAMYSPSDRKWTQGSDGVWRPTFKKGSDGRFDFDR